MIDPHLEEQMRARIAAAPFAQWMGIELVGLDDGESEIHLTIEPHHRNPGGIPHGGIVATLIDVAIGLAHRTKLGMEATHVTVELRINYLRAIREGTLIARGTAVHWGERTGYGEATLLDAAGHVLARGSATFLVLPGAAAAPGSDA